MTPKEQWKLAFAHGRLISQQFHDADYKRCGALARAVKYACTADDPLRLRPPMWFWLRQKQKRWRVGDAPSAAAPWFNCRCVVRPVLPE